MSEDPRTAPKGGELGCFAAGKLAEPNTAKPVDDAVFALSEGKVSEVVKTSHGLHLVKLDKIAKGEDAEKLGRQAVTLDLYLQLESERLTAEAAKQMLAAVQGGKSLEDALHTHLMSVLPEDAKQAYEAGRAQGKDEKKKEGDKKEGDKKEGDKKEGDKKEGDKKEGDKKELAQDAWSDPTRPQVRTSDPFTNGTPPFSQVQNPPEAASMLFALSKPGAVPKDVIKLYDGYAVARLKEKKPVEQKTWDEKRHEYMDALRREKQRDALVAYVQQLKELYAKDVIYPKTETSAKPGEPEPEPEPEQGDG
jgi:hypothetical protein